LTSQSLEIFDDLYAQDKNYLDRVELKRSDISKGVISEYLEIIEFLADRHDLKEEKSTVTPIFPRNDIYPQVVLFYKGAYKIDNSNPKTHPSEWCWPECETLLLGGHTENVLRVQIDVETLKPVTDSIRVFEKLDSCDTTLVLRHRDTNLHPCLKMSIPVYGVSLLERDGLYVYTGQVSPLWPEIFYIDGSKLRPDAGILAIAYERPVEAFNHLDNISARSDSYHRTVVEKRSGSPDKTLILTDQIGLHISPSLPEEIIQHLIKSSVGDKYFSDVDQDGEKIWTHDPGEIYLGVDFNRGEELVHK